MQLLRKRKQKKTKNITEINRLKKSERGWEGRKQNEINSREKNETKKNETKTEMKRNIGKERKKEMKYCPLMSGRFLELF